MQNFKVQKSEFRILSETILLLSVLIFMSFFYYGMRSVIVVFISIISAYITDIICCRLNKKEYDIKDLSSIVTGIVLALMMPASVPYHIMVVTSCFSIIVAKQIFGGKNNAIFVPAAVGYVFSSFCWREMVMMYPKPGEILSLSSYTSANLFQSFTQNLNIATIPSNNEIEILTGRILGPMGATHIVILLISAVIMVLRKNVSALTFLTGLGTILFFGIAFPVYGNSIGSSVLYELSSGMVLFGLLFISCDYFTSPKNRSSRFLYGLIIGILTVMFRRIGKVENAVIFATIIANPIGISLDRSAISFNALFHKYLDNIKSFAKEIKSKKNEPKEIINKEIKENEQQSEQE